MADSNEISRIQSYLREAARGQYQTVSLPPFTLFFHPTDSLRYFNYAIPDRPCGDNLAHPLQELCQEFYRRGRTPRFEFFEAFAPELPAALRVHGFVEEARQWSMICTPQTLRPISDLRDIQVITLGEDSSEADVRDYLLAQRQGFDPENTAVPGEDEIREALRGIRAGTSHAFLARADGEPASAAVFGRPIDGVSEVAGIATRVPYRRRGIATLLTACATRAAFASGAQTVCLTAADENAGHVYEKVGFQPFSLMLAYAREDTEPASASPGALSS